MVGDRGKGGSEIMFPCLPGGSNSGREGVNKTMDRGTLKSSSENKSITKEVDVKVITY